MEAVNVIIRFRGGERGHPDEFVPFSFTSDSISLEGRDHTYSFDQVLRSEQSQEELYHHTAKQVIINFLEGFNATVFAYGQSGSGKTFSMLGPEEVTEVLVNGVDTVPESTQEMYGIIPRATLQIFDIVSEGIRNGTEYSIKCSYIEIYNEMVNDILCSPVGANLKLREFPKLGMCVIGMTERFITKAEEVFECLSMGTANRIVCATGQNARSSRSHTVFVIVVDQKLPDGSSKVSKLNLVDLAGSEKLSKTGATGQALKEAQNINLSLTTLGRCIKALTSSSAEHVPYRESKLTLILKESLGGNAKTSLLCTASGKIIHKEETLGTLAFAERAKRIQNKATSNVTRSAEELMQMVEQLKQEVSALRKQLKSRGDNPNVPLEPSLDSEDEVHFQHSELKLQYQLLQENTAKEIERLQSELERVVTTSSSPLQVREIEDELINLKAEKQTILKNAEETRLKLESQVEDLETRMQENASILFNYQEELMGLEDKVAETKEELIEKEAQLKQAIESKEDLANDLSLKQQLNMSLKKELEVLTDLSEKQEGKLNELKRLYNEKEQLLITVQENLVNREGEISILKLEQSRLKDTIEQYSQDKASLELRVEDLKAHNEELRTELSALHKKYQALSDESAAEKTELKGKLEETVRELNSYKSKAESLEIELENNKLTHEQLEEREELISKMRKNHETELKELLAEQENIRTRHEEALAELQSKLSKEVSDHELFREKCEADLLEASMQAEALEVAHQASSHEKIELEYTIKKIQQELATALAHNASLAETLQQKTTEFDSIVKANRDLIVKHSITLQTAKSISNSHSKKLEEVYKELADARVAFGVIEMNAQKELSQAQEEADKLRLELKYSKQQLSLKEASVDELRLKNIELEKQLASFDIQYRQLAEDSIKSESKQTPAGRFSRRGSIVSKINSATVNAYGGVKLRKTDNKFMQEAIMEAKKAQELAPVTPYKVYYGYDAIKSLYANTEEIDEQALAGNQSEESKTN